MTEQLTPEEQKTKKKSHRTLIILACLFAIPYAAAFFLYFNDDAASSLKTSNNGTLVSPMRKMEMMDFVSVTNNLPIAKAFSDGWTMVTLAPSNCDTDCTDNLYAMKQVRLALGVERNTVYRAMVLLDDNNTDTLLAKLGDFSGMDILTTSSENLLKLKQFLQVDENALNNAVFLFDPQGNYMMYYGTSTHPKLILKDMQLLLKVASH